MQTSVQACVSIWITLEHRLQSWNSAPYDVNVKARTRALKQCHPEGHVQQGQRLRDVPAVGDALLSREEHRALRPACYTRSRLHVCTCARVYVGRTHVREYIAAYACLCVEVCHVCLHMLTHMQKYVPWNLKLGIWTLELGTWTLKLGTWNLELEACTWELGTWSLELGTWCSMRCWQARAISVPTAPKWRRKRRHSGVLLATATATPLQVPAASKKQKLRGAEKLKKNKPRKTENKKVWSQNRCQKIDVLLETQFIKKNCESKNGSTF